ncbi:L-aspartate oxidase [Metabacillus litoralis]|uniref:L-aspartate oxidase n=1 Tax=Metabacillus litoralis TaxID=152268 RepID=A0A5C6VX80_9BACI|nr:L-aspartate oxidase [Metabacillus litoralis]TXC90078.1 L-aspartate oxidase [Metabacillus litoralis]
MPQTDVIIIGSGLAALSTAYHLRHKHITMITKSSWVTSNSMLAQGGIAAAVHHRDSWKSHFADTLVAGCYHNNETNVEYLVQDGPSSILEWCERGMNFDYDEKGELLLGKEGAHTHHRIIHAGGDATGKELTKFLYQATRSSINLIENELVIDLIIKNGQCLGVYTKNKQGEIEQYLASKTIIASGGCGAVYGHTSNADVITGDGIAMAYRAGAEIADMEFIQFHPTMLHIDRKCVGLISEAVRGEGATLINQNGKVFMNDLHHQGDLAPRDVVSRAIFDEMKKGNTIYLDISMIANFTTRFPTISKLCREHKIDLASGKIPVAPGMHFLMGGILTNDKGETSIPNLFAVGEAACTGVHGANRLASNSLLEGLVFGKRIAEYISTLSFDREYFFNEVPSMYQTEIELPNKKEIQEIMTKYVGIQRTENDLLYAVKWFESYKDQVSFWDFNVKDFTIEQIEVINMLTIGWIISSSALTRTESRGGHFRLDFPESNDQIWRQKYVIRTKDEMQVEV